MDSIQSDRNLFGNEILGHTPSLLCVYFMHFVAQGELGMVEYTSRLHVTHGALTLLCTNRISIVSTGYESSSLMIKTLCLPFATSSLKANYSVQTWSGGLAKIHLFPSQISGEHALVYKVR